MSLSPADLRAELARRRVRLYELAPLVGLHPARLGAALNERIPMPAGLANKIEAALAAGEPERRSR